MFISQEDMLSMIEHITGENPGEAPLSLLTVMSKIYLEWKFPELKEFDFNNLAEIINGSKDVQQNRKRFNAWLVKHIENGKVCRKYRVRTMSKKVYASILTYMINQNKEGKL